MSTNQNLWTSPVGTIVFMAAENPVKESNGESKYSIRLAFDAKADEAFLNQVASVNDTKVVTAKTYRGKSDKIKAILDTGKALVSATTKFKPDVFDSQGNKMEAAPYFFEDSTGTAQMIVQPYKGDKGGTINLMGIIVQSIESPEHGGTGDRATRLAQLQEAVDAATKG